MVSSLSKDIITPRGFKYHYSYSPAQEGKRTLLFCHGFPSSARDWYRIAVHFKEQGYGIIIPDMLGYGGTDKPIDPTFYALSAVSQDIVSILDAEKVEKVVAIGHDWGSAAVSRLANWYPERVSAYAFFALPYYPPVPKDYNFEADLASQRQKYGYELYGYWSFFNRDDANHVIQDHIESFVSVLWPHDPKYWLDHFAPTGTLERSLLENWTAPLPAYLSEEDKQEIITTYRANGFTAPTSWYKIIVRGIASADDAQIPAGRAYPPAGVPVYFGAAKNDLICLPSIGYDIFKDTHFVEGQVTEKEYDADHWVILSKADEISQDLEAWIKGFTA
ncbi:hypothetical protein PHLGIDRAFT_117193 [Phlebiopsis gigantea 11061_1 CR5-6]|uniref:AB hydrolase-1 domain-containing protein n=1 Tax=Phlebiopsis gigantea (strain 11061_1 CR5-6) TaxID=745531 RepID=A0A0C3S0K1_PHLG1|nr:hypothetical protein PHLGIDRAFT_117193 [Phlebiopsis gigantea 11061_1 CR5-6]